MNQTANQGHSGSGDNVAGNKTVYNYYSDPSVQPSQPLIATTAVIDSTLPPVEKWQGRQDEINQLQTALDNDNICLIEIIAAGGYGKTALTVKLTEQLTVNLRLLWVNFNQPYPLAQFGRWLLEQLEQAYDEKWNEEILIQQIIQGLITEPCLLVLNNLETVLTAEGNSVYQQFLSRWLAKGQKSKLLLTSREQPKFANNLLKRCYRLPLKGLAEADAIRLVTEDYGLTGTEKELAQFVHKMARHPLLMQLVSSLMIDEFGEGICVTEAENLGLNVFDVEGYHRDTETCVREVVEASLKRLSDPLEDSLKRLSVLRKNFDLELAQGITADVTANPLKKLLKLLKLPRYIARNVSTMAITEEDLRYLARLSLLQEFPPEPQQRKPRRFQFLPLISMVVQQEADAEVLRSAHQKALDYYLAHLPAPPWESLEDLTPYLEAFYHAGALGNWQLAYDILNEERGGEGKDQSVDEFLDLQGFNQQRSQLYEQVITGSKKEQHCYGASHCNLGNCYYSLGQYKKAIAHHQQYHDISEEMGDRQGVAISLGNLGLCYYSLGQYEKAIAHHQQSIDISEEMGDRQGVAISLGNLGNCYYSLGQYEKAIAHHQQSVDIKEEIGDREGLAFSLNNIGYVLIEQKNYSEAERKIQDSLVISQEINYQYLIAHNLKVLAEIAQKTNRLDLALTHCQEALELSQKLGIPLVKDCEELLAQIQDTLEEDEKLNND